MKKFISLGSPLLDLIVDVTPKLLKRFNYSLNNTYMLQDPNAPIYQEIMKNQNYVKVAGGATLNSARCSKWINKDLDVQFVGCLGNDQCGNILKQQTLLDKVKGSFEINEKKGTGKCAVMLANHDRSMATYLGASQSLTESFVKQHALKQADFFMSESYYLYANPLMILNAYKRMSEMNIKTCLTLGAVNAIKNNFKSLEQILPYVDFVFGNTEELKEMGKQWGKDDLKIEELCRLVSKFKNVKGDRITICTQGSQNVIISDKNQVESHKVTQLDSNLIVDTNGAGDAFCGGQKRDQQSIQLDLLENIQEVEIQ